MMEGLYFLRAGQLVIFTTRVCNDYILEKAFVALQNVSQSDAAILANEVAESTKKSEEKTGWYEGGVHADFISKMVEEGWLVSVD